MIGVVEFGPFALDRACCELRRGGEVVPVQRKVFDLLAYLIEHHDRLVSRQELLDRVWEGTRVSPISINRTVNQARRALNEERDGARWIATVHGRGYRFVGALSRCDEAPAALPALSLDAEQAGCRPLIVGRKAEQSALREALRAARQSVGSVVLLEGESGIGKSSLLEWCVEEAGRQGALAILSRCRRGAAATPLLLWMDLLRQLGREHGLERRPAPLLDELAEAPGSGSDPGTPLRIARDPAVVELLEDQAARRPLALLIDDLDLADPHSIQLLAFVAARLTRSRVVFVATLRPPPRGLAEDLARVARVRSCVTLSVEGLAADDVHEWLRTALPQRDTRELALRVWERTAGNAFFVQQLLPLLGRSDAALAALGSGLPQTVRKAIEQRCEVLSERAREVLQAASVFEHALSANALAVALGQPLSQVLEALDEASTARLLAALPDPALRYRFVHPLVREALYAALPTQQRGPLHWRVALALEGELPLDDAASELAHHYEAAASEAGVERAVRYHTLAGDRAARRAGCESALAHYRRALDLHASSRDADPAVRCALLRRLARQTLACGRAGASRALWAAAAEQARAIPDPVQLAEIALEHWRAFDGAGDAASVDVPAAKSLAEESLRACASGPGGAALRARLLSRLALALELEQHSEEAEGLAAEAALLAAEAGDALAQAECLIPEYVRRRGTPEVEARAALALRISRSARQACDEGLAQAFLAWRACDLAELGNFRELDAGVAAFADACDTASPLARATAAKLRCMRALMAGDFERARSLSARAIAATEGIDRELARELLCQRLAIDLATGCLQEHDLAPFPQVHAVAHTSAALFAYQEFERPDLVRHGIEYLLRGTFPRARCEAWLGPAALLAQAVVYVGDRARAALLREWLRGFESLHAMLGRGLLYLGPVRRYTGLLDAALGDSSAAVDSLEAALADCTSLGARTWEARLHADLAEVHAARARGKAPDAAHLHASAALDLARTLGMDLLERRARELRGSLPLGKGGALWSAFASQLVS